MPMSVRALMAKADDDNNANDANDGDFALIILQNSSAFRSWQRLLSTLMVLLAPSTPPST